MTLTAEEQSARAASALRVFGASLAVLLLLQIAMNLLVNPIGTFGDRGILRGDLEWSSSNQKLETLRAFLARNNGTPVDISLGSSRVMALPGTANTTNSPYFNVGIPGAKSEDILAFSRYLADYPSIKLDEVIIAVDPGTVRDDSGGDYGLRTEGVYDLRSQISDRFGKLDRLRSYTASLLSVDWTFALAGKVLDGQRESRAFDRQTGVRGDNAFRGRLTAAGGNRDKLRTSHITGTIDANRSIKVDDRRIADLKEAVRILERTGARVMIVKMPYYPDLLTGLEAVPAYHKALDETNALIASIQQETPGVVLCDLTDANAIGLDSNDLWWDGYHYTAAGAEIIAQAIRSCGDNSSGTVEP